MMADSDQEDLEDVRKLVQQQNRKKKKSGGFQSMGLSHAVFKGVQHKGYKVPTPIQRKTIPLLLDGKDVVAMARTGSGKTAAFLVPMFERLRAHSPVGVRALLLSPTRELALQTLKFAREIGKYTGLKAAVILGGDSMDDQFAALHENPDIIIATPGRFMHVLVEMDAKLSSLEYIVFDEADRLFEMGFKEQLFEIIKRVPESRQTALFSATLPKLLVEFARAGLHNPTLVRLDVETKLSENLKMAFIRCRTDDKLAVLLHLLSEVIKPREQTLIFAATKHHVEYLKLVLTEAGHTVSYSYSSLDPANRRIQATQFREKQTMILIVTDLAARGIDIPLLNNVINFNFPAKSKLFVHRVGRVARAGQSGTAYSILGPDEMAYLIDLHLFLGIDLRFVTSKDQSSDRLIGCVPQQILDEKDESIRKWHQLSEIELMLSVIKNAYGKYLRSRPVASSESIHRAKEMDLRKVGFHPLFGKVLSPEEEERSSFLERMKSYKPSSTIFEVNASGKTQAFEVMKEKRAHHRRVITTAAQRQLQIAQQQQQTASEEAEVDGPQVTITQDPCDQENLQDTFKTIVGPKKSTGGQQKANHNKKNQPSKDEDNFISYTPKDYRSEKGLSIGTSFENSAKEAVLDFMGDQEEKKSKTVKKWDRKRKKFVGESGLAKKIKTESGQWIAASYKTTAYKDWLNKSKAPERDQADSDSDPDDRREKQTFRQDRFQILGGKQKRGGRKDSLPPASRNTFKRKGDRTELKRVEQIVKSRKTKKKKQSQLEQRTKFNKNRKSQQQGKQQGKQGKHQGKQGKRR